MPTKKHPGRLRQKTKSHPPESTDSPAVLSAHRSATLAAAAQPVRCRDGDACVAAPWPPAPCRRSPSSGDRRGLRRKVPPFRCSTSSSCQASCIRPAAAAHRRCTCRAARDCRSSFACRARTDASCCAAARGSTPRSCRRAGSGRSSASGSGGRSASGCSGARTRSRRSSGRLVCGTDRVSSRRTASSSAAHCGVRALHTSGRCRPSGSSRTSPGRTRDTPCCR